MVTLRTEVCLMTSLTSRGKDLPSPLFQGKCNLMFCLEQSYPEDCLLQQDLAMLAI